MKSIEMLFVGHPDRSVHCRNSFFNIVLFAGMRRILRVFPAHHRESTSGDVQGVLFIKYFQKEGETLRHTFRYLVTTCLLGLLVGCSGGPSGTPMEDDLQAKRDVASYLEEMYDSSEAGGFSLGDVKEKCKYIEMDAEKVSGNPEDVAAFKDLLGKLKKVKTEDEAKELCAKMVGLIALPEVWQTQFVRDNKK